MERRWLLLCDCAALVLALRQLGEDDARQCVKVMLLDYGERLRVRVWQPDAHRRKLEIAAHGRPDFRSLHVNSWPMSTVTATPYGRLERLEVNRADFVALLDELCPETPGTAPRGRKSGGETRNQDILAMLGQMRASGELEFRHGGLRQAAKQIHKIFQSYELKSIEDIISPTFNQWRADFR
jgi:hypothetical protein